MSFEALFAGVAVRDFALSAAWYGRLFGRPPDVDVHEHEAMWRIGPGGWVYVVEDPARAGGSLVTVAVDDLERAVDAVGARGLEIPRIEAVGGGRKATWRDLDANTIAFIEVPGEGI